MTVAAALLVCGCDSSPAVPASAEGSLRPALEVTHPEGAPVPAEPASGALPKQLAFELVDAGSGELAPLRYALAAGEVEHTVETRLTTRRLEASTWTRPVKQPVRRDGFAITPGDKPGRVAMRALPGEIVGAKTPESEVAAAAWKLLANRRLVVALDDRGQLGAIDFADDPNHTQGPAATDEAVQRLLGALVPLPAEPVGVGATWRVTTALRGQLATVKQTATYTLAARSDAAWKIHVAIRRDATPQEIVDPSLPPGTREELVAMVRTVEGDVAVVPVRALGTGILKLDSRTHLRLTQLHAAQVEQLLEDTGEIELGTGARSKLP